MERAQRGDHDAFAALAGAAISKLTPVAWLILRDPEQARAYHGQQIVDVATGEVEDGDNGDFVFWQRTAR